MAAPRLALSVVVLMLAAIALTEGLRGSGPTKCCFHFNEKPFPSSRVAGYVKTSQQCPTPAIMLTTINKRQLCVRPSAEWVQTLIKTLEAKAASSHL